MKIPEPRQAIADVARTHSQSHGKSSTPGTSFAATLKSHVQRDGVAVRSHGRQGTSAHANDVTRQAYDEDRGDESITRSTTSTAPVAPKKSEDTRTDPEPSHERSVRTRSRETAPNASPFASPTEPPIALPFGLPFGFTSLSVAPPLARSNDHASPVSSSSLSAEAINDADPNAADFVLARSVAYGVSPFEFEQKTAHSQTNLLMMSIATPLAHTGNDAVQTQPSTPGNAQQAPVAANPPSDVNVAVAADASGMQVYVRVDNAASSNLDSALHHVTDQLEQVGIVKKRITINGKTYYPDASLFGDGNGNAY